MCETSVTMVESESVKTFVLDSSEGQYILNPYSGSQRQGDIEYQAYCSHCDLSFDSLQECEHHNLEMHGQKRLLSCDTCSATFRRQDHLKRHMHSLHSNQKYCVCPVCAEDCKRQDLLQKHIKLKHGIGPQIFHCRDCKFQCPTLSELEKHEETHISTERHVCPHCQTSFKRRDHMLRHVKSQHLNQFVVCPVCKQTYKRKDHLVRHVREKHKMGLLNGKLVTSSDIIEYTI